MKILVTGGAGYIGSHTCVELLHAGHQVVVLDNFSNSHPDALARTQMITGKHITCVHGDVRHQSLLETTLTKYACEAVVHFAGLKAVGESVKEPLHYYDNNVAGTLSVLRAMQATGVHTIIFSSSATVYGTPQFLPYTEQHPLSTTSAYGQTKLVAEEMLRDLFRAEPHWKIAILRYFNPVGAHESGMIGEAPQGTPNNLMPYVTQVAIGQRPQLHIWGNDYATPDGTGVRDYLHVVDLALGHVSALNKLHTPACFAINLGTGTGHSVLNVIQAFEEASGLTIPYTICARRPGDLPAYYADASLAKSFLGWEATRDLITMCRDAWRWQQQNPQGYV
jgi:UDP-glucose 4-epimerase